MRLSKNDYIPLIKRALKEDLDKLGDVTTDSIFTEKESVTFKLLAKDDGILCGAEVFTEVFKIIDKKTDVKFYFKDGDALKKGDIVARVKGDIKTALKGERTSLNFISHLSGISSKTNAFVKEAGGFVKILDTRKTIPGLRNLQKYAVKTGGGENHRIGLYDMVLIKDNHIDAAGGVSKAVEKVRARWKNRFKIEVETRNFDEIKEALSCKVDRIMLDNMSIDNMKEAVKIIDKKSEIEISGNMTLEKIKAIREIGIDYISFGELTHTVKVFDFSLKKE
ncbi:MAG TPA: carboxylating nicotinate-nucleotide diphosphorylase [Spirochaetota bacterium]|nr:carboxylating nicotinate-nucleotide diphosphorylase [Spirochaetota bacterium]HOS33091.1 carboxylating nicotinate-nucleotide diphosphorylase [Spirochaetota bacterium]HOS55361.1 carboxylating nicotinate-nucleotide diphosphorylase [Spirochaetota bacterium]HPK61896.1 carboxylating nicotinate-nucleotide diphosphorylase [Spirochaetota bacterium]HQF77872.1 carboxylating nicotinate-nucleotide diphosphorylase [Spirochaetota bacterium]